METRSLVPEFSSCGSIVPGIIWSKRAICEHLSAFLGKDSLKKQTYCVTFSNISFVQYSVVTEANLY